MVKAAFLSRSHACICIQNRLKIFFHWTVSVDRCTYTRRESECCPRHTSAEGLAHMLRCTEVNMTELSIKSHIGSHPSIYALRSMCFTAWRKDREPEAPKRPSVDLLLSLFLVMLLTSQLKELCSYSWRAVQELSETPRQCPDLADHQATAS